MSKVVNLRADKPRVEQGMMEPKRASFLQRGLARVEQYKTAVESANSITSSPAFKAAAAEAAIGMCEYQCNSFRAAALYDLAGKIEALDLSRNEIAATGVHAHEHILTKLEAALEHYRFTVSPGDKLFYFSCLKRLLDLISFERKVLERERAKARQQREPS